MDISIVIPVFNEDESTPLLYTELNEVLTRIGRSYEIIFINDGSSDNTLENLKKIRSENSNVKIIDLNRNFGQTAAIMAGFHFMEGEIAITMDSDLQNDPHDIAQLLEEIDKGFDIISGWRKKRKDGFTRTILSRFANLLISKSMGLKLHDYGCTLKAYRKDIVKNLNLYGEMHRFIPAVASWKGARIKEIEVNHRPRKYGRSKYGSDRIGKVLLDLLVMVFLSGYHTKPIRFFGNLAVTSSLFGLISFSALVCMKIFRGTDMTGNPFLILTTLFFLVSIQLLSIGLIGELNIRTYFESQNKKTYHIREILK